MPANSFFGLCSDTPLNFKQTNITNYFGSSKDSCSKYKCKPISQSMMNSSNKNSVIIIDSDDSDFETVPKRIFSKRKLILPYTVSDEEEVTSVSSASHQKSSQMMQLNKPKKKQINESKPPLATSTPCRNFNTSDHQDSDSDSTVILSGSMKDSTILSTTLGDNDEKIEVKHESEDILNTSLEKYHVYVNDELSDVKITPCKHLKEDKGESILHTETSLSSADCSKSINVKKLFYEETTPSGSKDYLLDTKKSFTISNQLFTPTKKNKIKSPKKITPKKNSKKELSPSSSPSKRPKLLQSSNLEVEDMILNLRHLESMKKLFVDSLEDDSKNKLLLPDDVEVIEKFLKMDVNHQYVLMKLFTFLPKWYDIIKLCKKIKIDQKMSVKEICAMYDYLSQMGFIETELADYGIDQLLNMLMLEDLRKLCDTFRLGKLKTRNKTCLIEALKKQCKTQATLSVKKSTEDLLKEEILKWLGHSFKLKQNVRASFYKTYLLQTFTNSLYIDVQAYLSDVTYLKIVYPDYIVDSYSPFSNREQFSRFYEAVILKKDFCTANDKNNYANMKEYCDEAFQRLKTVGDDGKCLENVPDYIKRFSAEYQYISILKSAVKKLVKYHESVKIWLEYLIANYPAHRELGFWYKHLGHIYVHYAKNYEAGAKIVVEAFEFNDGKDLFDPVQIFDLSALASKIRTTKSYKVCASFCEKLETLAELPMKSDNFPKKMITGQTDRSGITGTGKRTYSFVDDNNEKNFGSVEAITLNHYKNEENLEGIHCEGSLITLLFTLLFFDLIYDYYVPNTFISKMQRAPLDMYSPDFYKNRRKQVDCRLRDIGKNWSEEYLTDTLRNVWDQHSHEETLTKFTTLSEDFEVILLMFQCIDRGILSDIFKRLISNYSRFHSGMPDLFLWNFKLRKCKFVEVKGEGDKLSLTQMLWIRYLMDIGADVEVCHVSGVGSRKIKTPKE